MKFVIDTNILLSALIKDSTTRRILMGFENEFYYPKSSFFEIKKYKGLVIKKSGMDENEYVNVLDYLLEHITLLSDEFMRQKLIEAKKLMNEIDSDDVIFLACAFVLNSPIWSNDKHFKKQDKVEVFTTNEFVKKFLKNNVIK